MTRPRLIIPGTRLSKTCGRCGETLPRSEFRACGAGNVRPICRMCESGARRRDELGEPLPEQLQPTPAEIVSDAFQTVEQRAERMISLGWSDEGAAREIGCSEGTIRRYRAEMKKRGVRADV